MSETDKLLIIALLVLIAIAFGYFVMNLLVPIVYRRVKKGFASHSYKTQPIIVEREPSAKNYRIMQPFEVTV
ncbi:hypothetical protein QR680_011393 [Steinernema hermaphroditum]|uniref:Uncharacterized protein n=1 Tax=Steinernema hermaphroditum TaxID=289476 RepID=A0AA39ITM6_9BILA|nr:hypothetical protein QR680_011393 [Steinernema hermaphroditum]